MLDIGFQELLLILVIALLVFGPKRLPELGRAVGRAMREFRRASDEFRSTIETNLNLNAPDPIPAPSEPVAADSPEASGTPIPPSEPAPGLTPEPADQGREVPLGEPFVARRGSRLFHARSCEWVSRIPEPERVYLKRVSEAKDQGYTTCPVCEPWEAV